MPTAETHLATFLEDVSLIVDLHRDGDRQGPGGAAETALALRLAGLRPGTGLKIADIGCGTGASALLLAQHLDAEVIAVDRVPAFLAQLEARAREAGLGDRISTLEAFMDSLPFEAGTFDVIWSEGAVYNMGFAPGVAAWRRFLKPGGILAVSDLTWLTRERPAALEQHWEAAYPGVDTASVRTAILEACGYAPLGYLALPRHCWLDNYYRPLQARFDAFLARHDHAETAAALVAAEEAEIALYERYANYFSYGFYVARRTDD